ncbi:DNA sulfur modification protein DndD [Nonomuraea turkmeniaca]|uniref:Nuclease SbcCD subunit C n=1 Tax=Nonomuraea turkmeniaca TaxID=103838 RepID=A0A5S4FPL0_9ACTN|nr:DNA sulfur modification protein DndD [Nonomuraea turkmeniaca]TMR22626.1 DNA sulfur modification protein DndD [Nonomuraea turkmeniaca]
MIFEELVLSDVGPFAGEHRILLAPRSTDQPVILLGGLNGSGKTTVLESLLLALYGALTPGSTRRAGSYEKYLRQLINRYADPGRGAAVELAFRAIRDGAWHTFRIQRRWWAVNDRIRDTVEVSRDGAVDIVLTEAWPEHVETLAPRGVANLFFFDGEQIEAFADLEMAKELVRTAIGGLLGLDLVDRLQEDLVVVERRKRMNAVAGEKEQQLLQAQVATLEASRRQEADALQAVDEAERDLGHAQRIVDQTAQRLAAEGGDRYRAREELQDRRHEALARYRQSRAALVEALGGLGPLLLLEPLIEQTVAQAVAERRQTDNQNLAEMLTERDARLLDVLRRQRVSENVRQAIADFFAEDVAHRKSGQGIPQVLGIQPQTLSFAERLLAGELDEEREYLRRSVEELAAAQSSAEDAERAVEAIPATDAVEESVAAYEKAMSALAEAHARWEAARRGSEEAAARRLAADRNVQHELLQANATLLQSEEARRIVEHAERARNTLAQLRAAATQRHTKRIEALILDSLQTLLRKEKLIREVRIDPETSELELLTHDGHPLRPGTLSAGERQLLAVSLLAGLARASGRLLPVVIDTPLGRLDRDHRHRLIERYLPQASHQVIVLSTDSEITSDVLVHLGSSVSHMIKLQFDQETRSTVVKQGYFSDGQEAEGSFPEIEVKQV